MKIQESSFQDIHLILDRMARDSAERQAEAEERQAVYKKQQIEFQLAYEERQKKLDAKMSKLSAQISGIGNNIGEVTEDYFYSSISTTLNVNGIQYNSAEKNYTYKTKKKQAEYDIVLINSTRLLVIEVKHKLHPNDVEKFATQQLPLFKELFPEYKNYDIYGAVAGITIPEKSIKMANELGLYVFTQSQDSDNMLILNPEGFEPKKI